MAAEAVGYLDGALVIDAAGRAGRARHVDRCAGDHRILGHGGAGVVVGLVTVAGFFVLALAWREPTLLGLGVVGVLWFVPQSVVYFVGDALGVALTLTLVGVALLASAALLMPMRDRLGHAWRVATSGRG